MNSTDADRTAERIPERHRVAGGTYLVGAATAAATIILAVAEASRGAWGTWSIAAPLTVVAAVYIVANLLGWHTTRRLRAADRADGRWLYGVTDPDTGAVIILDGTPRYGGRPTMRRRYVPISGWESIDPRDLNGGDLR